MIRLIAFLLAHENSIKLMFALNIISLIVLTVLHHFMKSKHHKLWAALCGIPLFIMLLFYIINAPGAVQSLFWSRYLPFGIAAFFILLWGIVTYFRGSFPAYTVLAYILCSISCLSVFVFTLIADSLLCLGDYSKYGWTESFSRTIDQLETTYITRYWKDIDFDAMREKYLPRIEKAEQENNEEEILLSLCELNYDLYDGHVWLTVHDMDSYSDAVRDIAGNDYGLSMFRDSDGEILAVLVKPESEAEQKGIKNGTVITAWAGEPVDEAASKVKCLDFNYIYSYIENEEIFQPVYLAGHGGETVEVSFIAEDGEEKTVTLSRLGSYNGRLNDALSRIFIADHGIGDNLSTCMLDGETGYLRVKDEEFVSVDDLPSIISQLTYRNDDAYNSLREKIEDLKDQGMKRMVIDIRNNSGGYGWLSQMIASMFVDMEMTPESAYLKGKEFRSLQKPRKFGEAAYSDIPVAVLVNVSTCSAGDVLAYYLSKGNNTVLIGNTYPWGCAQGIGGRCLLTGDKVELWYPAFPDIDENNEPIADAKSDRKAVTKLDYQVTYSKEEVLELFGDSDRDKVLEYALEYLSGVTEYTAK